MVLSLVESGALDLPRPITTWLVPDEFVDLRWSNHLATRTPTALDHDSIGRWTVKLLLTSAGVTNPSIHSALVDLLGKPIADSTALCIPTAQYGHPAVTPTMVRRFISGTSELPMCSLGWKSVGVLELTALPSVGEERWVPWVREADVLLVAGGDAAYLGHWMRRSGLAALLPTLHDTVWVGLSAGSMVLTPRVGQDFVQWQSPSGDQTLGVVDFSICPHVNGDDRPENTIAEAERWAVGLSNPGYVVDDDTAIRVVDGRADVVSEGRWTFLDPRS
jgi:dipeptidase E